MNALTLKNLLREIKRTFTKFLSIFAICALGVAFFAGIRATSPDMKEAGDRLYNTYNLSDISVISTSGLTADNIRDLESIEGIQAVRASLFVDAMARGTGEKEKNLRLYSMPIKLKSEYAPLIDLIPDYGIDTSPEYEMNGVEIVSGRMPLNDTEIALDNTLEGSLVKQLGDEITLTTSGGSVTLRVVGFIRSPMYISMFERGTSSIGNGTSDGFAYASGNAISSLGTKLPVMSLLNTYYTRADIVISGKEGLSAYSNEYEALVNEVTDRIEDYASTQSGTWYIQDRSGNPGYSDYSENTDRIAAVGDVFPLIFFIVAALVCLTTMTRMVEEQRIEMGTMKALGYGGWQIAMKYAVYAMSACISGGVVGAIIGFKLFPYVIMKGYSIMYYLGKLETPYRADIAFMAIAAMAVCTAAATFSACYASLKEVPATLMRPKAPKAGKRIFLERITPVWKRMKFTHKVTARNLFRYKKRFFMTVIGVAGCTALIITGLGLKNSVSAIIDKQFGEIFRYSAIVALNTDFDNAYKAVENCNGVKYSKAAFSMAVEADGGDGYSATIIAADGLKDRYVQMKRPDGSDIDPENGVVITQKLADMCDLSEGDSISFTDPDGDRYEAEIGGIMQNYALNYIFMTDVQYEKAFGKKPQDNIALLNTDNSASNESVKSELISDERVLGVTFKDDSAKSFMRSIKSMNAIVLLLIVCAAFLAATVLYNLANINITERMRELATVKVLGFYDGETAAYIYRESVISTAIGIIIGLGLGKLLHYFVVVTVEVEAVMFIRELNAASYIIGALLTAGFACIVNGALYFRLRNIDMAQSLKSIE